MSKREKNQEATTEPVEPVAGEPEVVPPPPGLESELAAAREESAKQRDLYLRSCADLDNYRKRVQREKEDLTKFANESILREVLPVVDNLERALQHAAQGEGQDGGLLQGVEMTLGQFRKVLEKFGVVPITALGTGFDPARHEAMGQIESRDAAPNTVVQELQRGYLLNERLLRPALVMIAKAPATQEENSTH